MLTTCFMSKYVVLKHDFAIKCCLCSYREEDGIQPKRSMLWLWATNPGQIPPPGSGQLLARTVPPLCHLFSESHQLLLCEGRSTLVSK